MFFERQIQIIKAQLSGLDTSQRVAIGLCAVWLQDCSPVYWIWQKCAFILGGLLLPLEIYPPWLREIALWTPFSAIMHGPGRMAFGWQPEVAALVAVKLLLWGDVSARHLGNVRFHMLDEPISAGAKWYVRPWQLPRSGGPVVGNTEMVQAGGGNRQVPFRIVVRLSVARGGDIDRLCRGVRYRERHHGRR